jgi:hypothetical protein
MDCPVTKHTIKRNQADRLLDLLSENYSEDLTACCSHLGINMTDLHPKDFFVFSAKGTPSSTGTYRFVHYEERRLAKILKVAADVAKNIECKG